VGGERGGILAIDPGVEMGSRRILSHQIVHEVPENSAAAAVRTHEGVAGEYRIRLEYRLHAERTVFVEGDGVFTTECPEISDDAVLIPGHGAIVAGREESGEQRRQAGRMPSPRVQATIAARSEGSAGEKTTSAGAANPVASGVNGRYTT